eukprot:758756-Hanusia_phi.AAC.2
MDDEIGDDDVASGGRFQHARGEAPQQDMWAYSKGHDPVIVEGGRGRSRDEDDEAVPAGGAAARRTALARMRARRQAS